MDVQEVALVDQILKSFPFNNIVFTFPYASRAKMISKENAEVLSTALKEAKIDIVGGEEHFFDTFAKSLSLGKAVDGLAGKSDTIQTLLGQLGKLMPKDDDQKH